MQLDQERHDFFAQTQNGAVLNVLAQPMPYKLVKLAELSRSRPPSLRSVGFFVFCSRRHDGSRCPLDLSEVGARVIHCAPGAH